MSDQSLTSSAAAPTPSNGPMLAADGTPLKKSLNRALRRQKTRALMLIAPLLIFILVTFIAPIADMLFRSVENQIVSETLPRTVVAINEWEPEETPLPPNDAFEAIYRDIFVAAEEKTHTRLGSRLNYETTGISSLFRKSGRAVDDVGERYVDAISDALPDWKGAGPWAVLGDAAHPALPGYNDAWKDFARVSTASGDDPATEKPWELLFVALAEELRAGALNEYDGPLGTELAQLSTALEPVAPVDYRAAMVEVDEDWEDPDIWATIKTYAPPFTPGYFLNAADMKYSADGIEVKQESERLYGMLFQRTLLMSLTITLATILLGYPVAFLMANLPMRISNLLMIFVLLPFWTSLLVRTSAWKVLLQQEGVINDLLVWIGLIADDGRLVMINNATGTIIAMTHILLPFMILPLYSVMQTIPPSYVRAAKSLGATNWTAFWRVYFPQSVPGIGAGSILVFIVAIGYYITPELVGGTTGVFISNRIAYHISTSLNWGLAAALGSILLVVVLILYWTYDRIVGIDNVKLG
ncbi:ABC transporter permease [Lutimaribacter sp. EGI FJ00015]|uniref:ABC transporter permease n=1 Tax=Lutimaribacter degradans TaxID=2945989 RepID=A0ACC5ZYM8_9RHOB|nr:ABC transporter permease [Lutimaribacter sp. EGI FJ00013]MCM2562851.1 ABC transporter permease [Lutimaribacter sp. EGI FJ00013]MCO0614008.1 ABC transporter permease [Lutimaribacter sp. EGI FJ00015]MCO0636980.1 ABC transporter permease [Lutimaribacter sp. EGI FJ00014]